MTLLDPGTPAWVDVLVCLSPAVLFAIAMTVFLRLSPGAGADTENETYEETK